MEFTEQAKQTILELLKSGKRVEAIKFIREKYGTSLYDAKQLLEAFEKQFGHLVVKEAPARSNNSAGCGGCLSGILKMISIVIVFLLSHSKQ